MGYQVRRLMNHNHIICWKIEPDWSLNLPLHRRSALLWSRVYSLIDLLRWRSPRLQICLKYSSLAKFQQRNYVNFLSTSCASATLSSPLSPHWTNCKKHQPWQLFLYLVRLLRWTEGGKDWASTPTAGHTVVDSNKFKETLAKQVHEMSAKQNSELMKRTDLAIERFVLGQPLATTVDSFMVFRIKHSFASEFDSIHKSLLETIEGNKQSSLAELKYASLSYLHPSTHQSPKFRKALDSTDSTNDEKLKKFEALLDQQTESLRKVLERLTTEIPDIDEVDPSAPSQDDSAASATAAASTWSSWISQTLNCFSTRTVATALPWSD